MRALAEEVRERYDHVDVLANNAGALFASRQLTSEGLEQTFALNHLAPFLLTNLLREHLGGGRVVTTASDAHRSGLLDLGDLQSEKSYGGWRAYGTSKLCNILFTRELAKRAPELHASCFHPGVVRDRLRQERAGDREDRRDARRAVPALARGAGLARSSGLPPRPQAADLTGVYVQRREGRGAQSSRPVTTCSRGACGNAAPSLSACRSEPAAGRAPRRAARSPSARRSASRSRASWAANCRGLLDRERARAGEVDLDDRLDPPGQRRHHVDAVGEEDRLGDVVGDQRDGRAELAPDLEQPLLQLARA